jgi:hypothetical protein
MRGLFLFSRHLGFRSPLRLVAFYIRRLPRWQPPESDFFITWRLYGSLPKAARLVPPSTSAGAAFLAVDKELDLAASVPMRLKNEQAADCFCQTLLSGESE